MIPHFVAQDQECEHCKSEIYIGYDAIFYDECLFCDTSCLTDHIAELNGAKVVTLTDDKIYRDVN